MIYSAVVKGEFQSRPNRFVAKVLLNGAEEMVHVKNTGRCAELLIPGAVVYLQDSLRTGELGSFRPARAPRKTRYDLIAVERVMESGQTLLINMDSQAPNQVAAEGFRGGKLILPNTEGKTLAAVRTERTFGDSRFDLSLEYEDGTSAFVEVKGVTLLEDGGIARFPDAPTQRGVKHVRELERVLNAGMMAGLLFVIQMGGVRWMEPNWRTHPEFGTALREAKAHGVALMAYTCLTAPDRLEIGEEVEVRV